MKHYIVGELKQSMQIRCGCCNGHIGIIEPKYANDPQLAAEQAGHIISQNLITHLIGQDLEDTLADWKNKLKPVENLEELEPFWSCLAKAALKIWGKPFTLAFLEALRVHLSYDDAYAGLIDQDAADSQQISMDSVYTAIMDGPAIRNDNKDDPQRPNPPSNCEDDSHGVS